MGRVSKDEETFLRALELTLVLRDGSYGASSA
jgi:hypothetical protein